ncbi:MAG: T9SS type A sorting domain-containing protein [Ignavibacteriaceae bacterium]
MKKNFRFKLSFLFCFLGLIVVQNNISAQTQRYVTVFYSVWANLAMPSSLYGSDVYNMSSTIYSPYPAFNWWGKPAYCATHGDTTIKNNYLMYFNNDSTQANDSLIDYHADLLTSAGVDFITLDLTNGSQQTIVNGAIALCTRYQWRLANGLSIPQIAFWVKDEATLKVIETQIFNVFNSGIFFNYLGKKLLLVAQPDSTLGAGDSNQPAVPTSGDFANYTARHCWGLSGVNGQYWCFKTNQSTPPPAFYYNGQPEEMCAPVACQASYMTTDGVNPTAGAVGRQNGAFFTTYVEAAKTVQPTFLFIHSWNEWTAQNFGTQATPTFVDMWREEYSADIEPMEGGHTDQYYQLMKTKIGEFKRAGIPDWEFTSDVQGWTATNQITGFGWQTGGYVGGTIAGTDANITSNGNLSIDITNNKYVQVRMANNSAQTVSQIYFITNTDNVWNEAKHIDFAINPNSGFTTYIIDMSSIAGWTGTLQQLRLDPCNGGAGTGSFQVDYIHIVGKAWEFTSDVQGWTAGNNISGFGWQTGGYVGGTITGQDAYMYSGGSLGLGITNNKYITVRMANNSSQTASQIYFITSTDNVWNEAKHKDFAITANSGFTTYTIDMSTVPGWTGTLEQLRLDPCNGSPGTGSFQVDYIHISNGMYKHTADIKENNKVTEPQIPSNYLLNQNYPNPFNPSTVIKYSIPKSGYVTLKVYSLTGQEVATLVNGQLSAGSYKVTFDASKLASGVYMYRIQSGDFTLTKKMILLK